MLLNAPKNPMRLCGIAVARFGFSEKEEKSFLPFLKDDHRVAHFRYTRRSAINEHPLYSFPPNPLTTGFISVKSQQHTSRVDYLLTHTIMEEAAPEGFQDLQSTPLIQSLGGMSVQDFSNTHPQPGLKAHLSPPFQHESTKRARKDAEESRRICKVKVVGSDIQELTFAIVELNQQLEAKSAEHEDVVQSLSSAHSTIQRMSEHRQRLHNHIRSLHDEQDRLHRLLRSSDTPLTTKIYLDKARHPTQVEVATRYAPAAAVNTTPLQAALPLRDGLTGMLTHYDARAVPTRPNAESEKYQDEIALLRAQIQTLEKSLAEERMGKAVQTYSAEIDRSVNVSTLDKEAALTRDCDEIGMLERDLNEKATELSLLKDHYAREREERRKREQAGPGEWDAERRVLQSIISQLEQKLFSQEDSLEAAKHAEKEQGELIKALQSKVVGLELHCSSLTDSLEAQRAMARELDRDKNDTISERDRLAQVCEVLEERCSSLSNELKTVQRRQERVKKIFEDMRSDLIFFEQGLNTHLVSSAGRDEELGAELERSIKREEDVEANQVMQRTHLPSNR
ncbi:hypothetical protein CVT24_011084 [Panaeolus cyanescens]|uniref:Uncharacterized protein n=1 Tax=Panaeolus cyanescens TaxID=181874 RepID=A0A409YYL3_9AGAR|nr:hypothetical protein CVT24_011084 [Panaeolus cyanescens]